MNLRDVRREARDLPLALIDPPELPARLAMDEAKLEELATNIRANGVLQPIIVFPKGDRYGIAAGHRRYMASSRAGLVMIPAIVYDSQEDALEAVKYAENRFREELGPAEEAVYFSELLERDHGGDVDRLCAFLGEKRAYVEGRLALFSGDREVFDALNAGKIGLGVAQELNRCTAEEYRRYLLRQAIAGGATKAVVSGWILDWQKQQALTQPAAAPGAGGAAPAAVPELNYFTCYACRGTEHVETMRPVNVHSHCLLAIVQPALEQHRRRGDAMLAPRTVHEARELIAQLVDQFPELVPSTS